MRLFNLKKLHKVELLYNEKHSKVTPTLSVSSHACHSMAGPAQVCHRLMLANCTHIQFEKKTLLRGQVWMHAHMQKLQTCHWCTLKSDITWDNIAWWQVGVSDTSWQWCYATDCCLHTVLNCNSGQKRGRWGNMYWLMGTLITYIHVTNTLCHTLAGPTQVCHRQLL